MDFPADLAFDRDDHDDHFHRPAHNIFDISAPAPFTTPHDFHFNSTLPAINSSMRYDPIPDPSHPPPPSSFPLHFSRHTPSPSHQHHHHQSRSRSRSRPPSSVGPARTTRSRRNNSVSSTSPPPARPQAILIPGSGHRVDRLAGSPLSAGAPGAWFVPSHGHSTGAEYSLPTPDSVHSHSHPHYTPFSLAQDGDNSQGMHLPPVSALHQQQHHQNQNQLHMGMGPNSNSNGNNMHTPIYHPHHPQHHHQLSIGAYGMTPPGSGSPGDKGISSPISPILSPIGGMSSSIPHTSSTIHHGTPSSPIDNKLSSHVATNSNAAPLTPQDKQALLAHEKRRRRRESHNAVERRRRDNINEKISELATLIPECMLDGTTTNAHNTSSGAEDKRDGSILGGSPGASGATGASNAATGVTTEDNGEGAVVKANKGMILRKSVEYIRYLQQLVTAQGARNRELEMEVRVLRGRSGRGDEEGEGESGSSGSPRPSNEVTGDGRTRTRARRRENGGEGEDLLSNVGESEEGRRHSGVEGDDEAGGEVEGGDEDDDARMMLHDALDMEFGGSAARRAFGLPSMPEGEGEGDADHDNHHPHNNIHETESMRSTSSEQRNHNNNNNEDDDADMDGVEDMGMGFGMSMGLGMGFPSGGNGGMNNIVNGMNGMGGLNGITGMNGLGMDAVELGGQGYNDTHVNGTTPHPTTNGHHGHTNGNGLQLTPGSSPGSTNVNGEGVVGDEERQRGRTRGRRVKEEEGDEPIVVSAGVGQGIQL